MLRMSFVIPSKPGENRRAILPVDLAQSVHRNHVYIEKNYGHALGIEDDRYGEVCGGIVSRSEAHRFPVVCDLKGPASASYDLYGSGQTIFGWLHADENPDLAGFLNARGMTCIEWSRMFERLESGKLSHVFNRNNYIAGRAAVRHVLTLNEKMSQAKKIALLGFGNVGRGAFEELQSSEIGGYVDIYHRDGMDSFADAAHKYDVVIDCMLWTPDPVRHVPDESLLLKRFKPGALLVNVGWGVFGDCPATSFAEPVISMEQIMYYGIDHTPSFLHKEASAEVSRVLPKYIDLLLSGRASSDPVLRDATVLDKGVVIDPAIAVAAPVFA